VPCSWIGAFLLAASIFVLCGTAVADPETPHAREAFRDCSECPEMVVVPPGTFVMGSSKAEKTRVLEAEPGSGSARLFTSFESPQHSVTIERPFGLARYPVTRNEFALFVRESGYSIGGGCTFFANHRYRHHAEADWRNPGFTQGERDPVVCVSWQGAQAYLLWLNDKLRRFGAIAGDSPYRLPSEAEWEYAARAGTQTARWWGDAIGSGDANCDGCNSLWDAKQPSPVGSFHANPFGLYDMLGNLWEWTQDCWNESYVGAPQDGAAWSTGKCDLRVIRAGSFATLPWLLRSATRTRVPDKPNNDVGFRVARTLP
jgi:formylglycine-generating enzyme required for sulfatase activity